MATLNQLQEIQSQWEKNRRALKSYGDEFKKLGVSEKDSLTLARQAAKLDSDSMKKKTQGLKNEKEGLKKVADVLGEIRSVGKDAFAGIGSAVSALSRGDAKGALDGLVDSTAALVSSLDLIAPGLGQAASAFVKFAGGGASLMYELAERTIDENQKLIELTNTFDALGSNIGNTGTELLDNFKELSRELPYTRAQLAKMAEPMLEAGIQGDKLDRALRAQASATSMLGERGGQAYASLAERARDAQRNFMPMHASLQDIRKTGLSTKDMADQFGISVDQMNMQLRFGAFNAAQFGQALDQALAKKGEKANQTLMGTIGTLSAKMREKIGMLFQPVSGESQRGLEHFSDMWEKFGNIFDTSTASGKMLHDTLHEMIDGTLGGAGNILHSARRGFKMLEIVWMTLITKADPLFLSLKDLNKELKKSGHEGLTFKQVLGGIGKAAEVAFKSMAELVEITSKFVSLTNSISKNKYGHAATAGIGLSAIGAVNPVLGALHLVGHASGGVVTGVHNGLATVAPAPGEGLASIGRGERIVPAAQANAKPGMHVTVEPGAIVIHGGSSAAQSHTDLTEEGLSLVFERIRLKQGIA